MKWAFAIVLAVSLVGAADLTSQDVTSSDVLVKYQLQHTDVVYLSEVLHGAE